MKIKEWFKANAVYIGLFILFTAVMCFGIFPVCSADYIDYDSSYQYFLNQHPLDEIWELIPQDYSPPLYSVALKAYTMVFGNSLFVMRTFSLFAVAGMIFISFFPVRRAFGAKTAVFCGIMCTGSASVLLTLTTIRPTIYGMLFMMGTVIYAYLAYFYDLKYAYVCLTVSAILGMYTHNISMLGAFGIYILSLSFALFEKDYKKLKRFLISGIICAVVYIPWLLVVIKQFGNVLEHFWTGVGSFGEIIEWMCWSTFTTFFDYDLFMAVICRTVKLILEIGIFMIILSRIDFKAIRTAKSLREIIKPSEKRLINRNGIFLFMESAVPLAVMLLFNTFVYRLASERYLYILGMAWVIFLAYFLSKHMNKILAYAVMLCTVINCVHIRGVFSEKIEKSTIEQMKAYIAQRTPGNVSFYHFHEHTLGIMSYYFPEADHYVSDDTFTVLRTYDVFTTNVINAGSRDNLKNYTDEYYFVISDLTQQFTQQFTENGFDMEKYRNDSEYVDAYYMAYALAPDIEVYVRSSSQAESDEYYFEENAGS